MIRVALGSVPKDSGTFTFYRNLRPALSAFGIDLRCVSLGYNEAELWNDDFADAGCHKLASRCIGLKRQAKQFVDWCADERINIVIGLNSAGILSAIPHLPEEVRVIARCANAFDEGYRLTVSGRKRLVRIVALSPRQRDDLVRGYGVKSELIELIPNGISPISFDNRVRGLRGKSERLELGFLGRLEHTQKGVLHLPGIVDALSRLGVPFRLRIAGKGRDERALRQLLSSEIATGTVEFIGRLPPAIVPEFLASIDIFLLTSHFEGMPNSLLEAMISGTVPVCFNIPGITDYMISHGRSGYLVGQEDCSGMAEHISMLDRNRELLLELQFAAIIDARTRFSAAVCAGHYARVFRQAMIESPIPWVPRPWGQFVADENFRGYCRRFVPSRARSLLRRTYGFLASVWRSGMLK